MDVHVHTDAQSASTCMFVMRAEAGLLFLLAQFQADRVSQDGLLPPSEGLSQESELEILRPSAIMP